MCVSADAYIYIDMQNVERKEHRERASEKEKEILGTQFHKMLNRPARPSFNSVVGRLAVISKSLLIKQKLLRYTTITTTTATTTTITITTITTTTITTTIATTTTTTITITIITTYRYLYIYNCVVWSGTLWYNRLVLTPYWNWNEFNGKKKSCNIAIVKNAGHGAVARRTSCVLLGYFQWREREDMANEWIMFLLNFWNPRRARRIHSIPVRRVNARSWVTIEFRLRDLRNAMTRLRRANRQSQLFECTTHQALIHVGEIRSD